MNKIELLSPAGDLERLDMALLYGADAVYLAGNQYGMRAAAGNFNYEQMTQAVSKAHLLGRKIYITCNTLPRENELAGLPDYLSFLNGIKVDGIICADLGVIGMCRRYAPDVPLHVSTQLGVVNSETCKMLYDLGARTVVLAREVSLKEIAEIRKNIPDDLRIEAFVHGAMCVSFSGRCLLSNYLADRDANRGQCAQPCRWRYHLVEENHPGRYFEISEDKGTFILNSNDMCMIEHIPELIDAGVDSLKIEGRMKSSYYTAVVTQAYRKAIDCAYKNEPVPQAWLNEVDMVSHRPYSTGFYYGYPGQNYSESGYTTEADVAAVVESCDALGNAVAVQRNKFLSGDELELLVPGVLPVCFKADSITDLDGNPVPDTRHAMMKFLIKLPETAPAGSIIRKRR